jgi:hypothetical protein
MLYWAEGSKKRNVVALTNSDAAMLELVLRFLRECYDIPTQKVTLGVNCHVTNGLSADEIVAWWLQRLRLPTLCARKPTVNHTSSASRERRGHVLPYGTARIAVHSTFLAQSIYGAIQEYAGFERPAWLD